MIEIANCVPADVEQWQWDDLQVRVSDFLTDSVAPLREEYWKAFWEDLLTRFPEGVQRFVGPVTGESLQQVVDRLAFLIAARETLLAVATRQQDKTVVHLSDFASSSLLSLQINEQGEIELVHNDLLDALVGVEADRIRQCAVCQLIFWAGRRDKKGCTMKCAKVLRTRRWREKYQDTYKVPRYEKAEQADPLGLKEKRAKAERERQRIASIKEPKRPHRRAPRLPGPSAKSKR